MFHKRKWCQSNKTPAIDTNPNILREVTSDRQGITILFEMNLCTGPDGPVGSDIGSISFSSFI